jgi:hypothetical protein
MVQALHGLQEDSITRAIEVRQDVLIAMLVGRIRPFHVNRHSLQTIQAGRNDRDCKLLKGCLRPLMQRRHCPDPRVNLFLHPIPVANAT